jgi:hypothetical protein
MCQKVLAGSFFRPIFEFHHRTKKEALHMFYRVLAASLLASTITLTTPAAA